MKIIYALFNVLILFAFLFSSRLINSNLEILNTPRRQIKFNSSFPVTVIKLWKFTKSFLKYAMFSIYPFFNINVPNSSSMTPKFRSWDVIMASHSIYGFNVENVNIKFIRDFLRKYWTEPFMVFTAPQVGDTVALRLPNSDTVYAKIIIAKEGDELYVRGNILTINNNVCPIEFVEKRELREDNYKFNVKVYKIILPGDKVNYIAIDDDVNLSDILSDQYIKIPKGFVFTLGLYLTNSHDSRSLLGLVPIETIFSKLQWVIMRNPDIRSLNPISIIRDSEFGISENI